MTSTDFHPGFFEPPRPFVLPQPGEQIWCHNVCYTLGAKLGAGAFGEVYECADEFGNELVAKVLAPRVEDFASVRSLWEHEMVQLQQLRHPNITYIFQAFEYRGSFYLILERCAGTLRELVARTPGFVGELWLPHVARDILNGLEYMHRFGIVHKDLHAGNVMFASVRDRMVPTREPVWQFKIADLGISRLEQDIRGQNTILAQWMLPPEYLKPDQFGVLGRHADIYHVGLLMLTLLLGHEPSFTADEILAGVPRQTAERLSSKFAPAVARALRRHVLHRTPSALDMWREIAAEL